ncbi:MAG: hypothetical protein IJD88_00360 [Clostridia bacterium]|nr:hypothetical protein [Clostridia bacterium]
MSETNNLLIEAEALYNDGLYLETTIKCSEIIETGEFLKEAYLLFAKAYLLSIPSTQATNSELTDTFYGAILSAVKNSKTFEEIIDIETEIGSTINEWERKFTNEHMTFLLNNPSLENWNAHTKTIPIPPQMHLMAILYIAKSDNFKKLKLSDDENKALREKYEYKLENKMTEEEKCNLYFSTGYEIFEKFYSLLEEYKYPSAEAWQMQRYKIVELIVLTTCILPHGIKDNIPNELDRLKKYAYVLNYIINAQVFPNGNRVVLLSEPEETVDKLKATYKRIKELDDSFVIPEIVTPKTTNTQTESGGCYVATAVYGSYNCPQVWTLRRYRDEILAQTTLGRLFIKTYYAISPTLVKWFGHTEWFKKIFKNKLDRMVNQLNTEGVEDTPYEDKNW